MSIKLTSKQVRTIESILKRLDGLYRAEDAHLWAVTQQFAFLSDLQKKWWTDVLGKIPTRGDPEYTYDLKTKTVYLKGEE